MGALKAVLVSSEPTDSKWHDEMEEYDEDWEYDVDWDEDGALEVVWWQRDYGREGDILTGTNIMATILEPTFRHAGSVTGNSRQPLWLKKNVLKPYDAFGNNGSVKLGWMKSNTAKSIGRVLTFEKPLTGTLSAGLVLQDITRDGKISAGDVFQGLNTVAQFIFPVYGLGYGILDLGFSLFSEKSLTQRIKDGTDSLIQTTYSID